MQSLTAIGSTISSRETRALCLKSMWQFGDFSNAKAAETKILATCSPTDGGTERVSDVDYGTVYQLAVEHGGLFMADVPGFDQKGMRFAACLTRNGYQQRTLSWRRRILVTAKYA